MTDSCAICGDNKLFKLTKVCTRFTLEVQRKDLRHMTVDMCLNCHTKNAQAEFITFDKMRERQIEQLRQAPVCRMVLIPIT